MVWISRIHADSCRTSPFHRLTCDNRSPRRSRERGRPHPEPAMRSPCSLGRVPTSVTTSSACLVRKYVPAIIEELAHNRRPAAIQTRFGVTATPAPRGGRVISRGSRAPCTAPCVSGPRAPAMRASRQWAPVLPEDGWRHRRAWRRRNSTPVPRMHADAHDPDQRGRAVLLQRAGAARHATRRIRDHRGRPTP